MGQSSCGTHSLQSKSSVGQAAQNYEDLATIYTQGMHQPALKVAHRTSASTRHSRHTSSVGSVSHSRQEAPHLPAMSKLKSQPTCEQRDAEAPPQITAADMRKSPSCRQLIRLADRQSSMTKSPHNRSEYAMASGGRSQIFGMSHANSLFQGQM